MADTRLEPQISDTAVARFTVRIVVNTKRTANWLVDHIPAVTLGQRRKLRRHIQSLESSIFRLRAECDFHARNNEELYRDYRKIMAYANPVLSDVSLRRQDDDFSADFGLRVRVEFDPICFQIVAPRREFEVHEATVEMLARCARSIAARHADELGSTILRLTKAKLLGGNPNV